MPVRNPLRADPTRTATLRRTFIMDMRRRFRSLQAAVRALIIDEDAFGLRSSISGSFDVWNESPVVNTRWAFQSDDEKLRSFQEWFQQQVDDGILELEDGVDPAKPWTSKYVHSAYRKARIRAFNDLNAESLAPSLDFFAGSQAQFLESSFAAPVATAKLRTLGIRAFAQLKGISAIMSQQLSITLSDGLAQGHSRRKISKAITDKIGSISKVRAERISRTEIIHAYAEGSLDTF